MKKYIAPKPITHETAEQIFATGNVHDICDALASVALNDSDWIWCQEKCLALLNHPDIQVSGLAATCLGHIARIHGKLDRERVVAELRSRLSDDNIGGRVQDALDDIEQFMPLASSSRG
jgi:hypothetical protein